MQPSYITAISGITGSFNAYAGYGYGGITTGKEAGLVGNVAGGNLFSFTVGANVPTVFNFGVLTNYSASTEIPTTVTLTSGAASASDTLATATYSGRNNLFTITGASAGQTFTVAMTTPNTTGRYISGATFDTIVPAPEPSSFAALAVGILGLGVLGLQARRRMVSAA